MRAASRSASAAPAASRSASGTYKRPRRQSTARSCQKFVSCRAVQSASDDLSSSASRYPRDPQHESSHRVGRTPAVVEHVVPGCVTGDDRVLPECAQQILEQTHLESAGFDRVCQGQEDRSGSTPVRRAGGESGPRRRSRPSCRSCRRDRERVGPAEAPRPRERSRASTRRPDSIPAARRSRARQSSSRACRSASV